MSAGSDSSKFTRVNPGDDIRGVSRSERIMALQNVTRSHINGEPYSPSANLNRIIGPGWVIHRQRRRRIFGGVGGATLPRTPFQIISRTIGSGVNQILQLGVINDSHLFNSEDKDTYEEDNTGWGLLDVDEEDGWITVTDSDIGKKFWLQLRLTPDQSIEAIDLRYDFPAAIGSWRFFPDPIEINILNPIDPYQWFYHQIIGEISNPDIDPREGSMTLTIPNSNGTKIQVNQLLFDDIFMTTGHTAQDANEPDIPIIVNSSSYQPTTDTGGTGTPIPSDINLMTPWQFGPSVDVNDYSFKMFNVSTFPVGGGSHLRVLILDGDVINESDGNRHTPAGMGNDDYVLTVHDNGDEIWLVVPHDNNYNVVDPVSLNTGTETPEDTDLISYITIGQVFIDFNDEPPLLTPHNTVCGDVLFTAPSEQKSTRYSFQMFDASDSSGQKVKLIDGDVIDQDDVVWTPAGMGNDDFTIGVQDSSDIYIEIQHDNNFNITANPTIHTASNTPDDTSTVSYITLGYVNFNNNVNPPTVDPHNSVCGDINFNAPAEINNYSFKMVDASTGDNAQVRVMDGLVIDSEGQEFQPGGMGNDQLVLQANDGWDVYLAIRFNQNTGAILDVQVQTAPQIPFDIPFGSQHVTIGKVFVDFTPNGPFVLGVNHLCGDFFFDWDTKGQYAFQMFDGSLTDGFNIQPAVRIADGFVLDNYGNKVQPRGMGNDALTIPTGDGYDVFLKIPIDDSLNQIDGEDIFILSEPGTPPDTDDFMYVTIGKAFVDQDGVFPVNEVCGDFFIDPPSNKFNFNFQLEDASIGGEARVRIYDGSVIGPNDDPKDPDGMPSDNSYIVPVSNGDEIWVGVQWNMETDDGVSGDNIESVWIGNGAGTPFDEGLIQYITIGHVEVGEALGAPFVSPFNEICGDIIIEFPPSLESDELLQLSVDKDTKNIVWKTSKIAQITTEDASGYSGDGQDFLDDIDVLTFNEEDFDLFDGGGGQAIVKLTSPHGFSVQGDAGFVDDVDHIQFTIAEDPSAGFINVTDGGDGVAIVEIPVLPTTGTGTQVLGSDGGDIQWFGTDTCTD